MINQNKTLAVIGSRTFNDYNLLREKLNLHQPSMIVSGGANGADNLSNKYAKEYGLPILIFYPTWNAYGKSAGFIRNGKIVTQAEEIVCFWDGLSRGTLDSIERAKKLNKVIYIYKFENEDFDDGAYQ